MHRNITQKYYSKIVEETIYNRTEYAERRLIFTAEYTPDALLQLKDGTTIDTNRKELKITVNQNLIPLTSLYNNERAREI